MLFTSSKLHLLIKPLQWLTGLILLSLILLVGSWAWLDGVEPPSHAVQSQCGDQPTFRIKSAPISTPTLKRGQSLFINHCQSCHEMTSTKRIGPGLLGVTVRAPSPAWLMRWIQNPSEVLQSGDAYANQLVKDYAPVVMPGFPKLKESDLKAILSYLDSYTVEGAGFAE
ncbi:cytochrome c [Spirosoma agri]|uniref:Cytochrome c n=1 Tax=Spirosoma agri TaxID=1987381 RepID=A0A6M0IQA3_9BACT|nr:cytochrome c [Spirosoma agri]